MLHHFIVGYDTDKQRWFVEILENVISGADSVWDTTTQQWESPEMGSDIDNVDREIYATLVRAVREAFPGSWPAPSDGIVQGSTVLTVEA